ncbi:hypothetical protein C5167_040155 [Papaver somniferum]|uniref:Uncharacterized protein n=1 Tax=Papaver somniferum TaxID=3469 RepID=A0A4Y7IID9_PAPSO|nr:hypothetical protein C5167_040155 [Papaver somniferum]
MVMELMQVGLGCKLVVNKKCSAANGLNGVVMADYEVEAEILQRFEQRLTRRCRYMQWQVVMIMHGLRLQLLAREDDGVYCEAELRQLKEMFVMMLSQNEKVSVQLQMDNGLSMRTGDIRWCRTRIFFLFLVSSGVVAVGVTGN